MPDSGKTKGAAQEHATHHQEVGKLNRVACGGQFSRNPKRAQVRSASRHCEMCEMRWGFDEWHCSQDTPREVLGHQREHRGQICSNDGPPKHTRPILDKTTIPGGAKVKTWPLSGRQVMQRHESCSATWGLNWTPSHGRTNHRDGDATA